MTSTSKPRLWRIMDGLHRCVITHEGHTIMCASAADARIVVESANSLIEAGWKEGKEVDEAR